MTSDVASDDYFSFDEEEHDYFDLDEASDGDRTRHEESIGIKEQMYREKRQYIKGQLQQLHAGTLPEFCKKQSRLEQASMERHKRITTNLGFLLNKFEREQKKEKEAIMKECEKKKQDLKLQLIADLEEKSKQLENDRNNTDLNQSSISATHEPRCNTRKLRPRANEPTPAANEKRRKEGVGSLNFQLTPEEIEEDLKLINAACSTTSSNAPEARHESAGSNSRSSNSSTTNNNTSSSGGSSSGGYPTSPPECKVENNKLYYERSCYMSGHTITLKNHRENEEFSANIVSISDREVVVRRHKDNSKYRIGVALLVKGRFTIIKNNGS